MTTTAADEVTSTQDVPAGCPICGDAAGHTLQHDDLDCPDCLALSGQHTKMGNKRAQCRRCNAFAQRLIRTSGRSLQSMFPADYERVREEAELDLYTLDVA